jgi:PilZ domain
MMTSDLGHSGAGSERRRLDRTAVTLETDIRFGGLDSTGFTADVNSLGAFVRPTDESDPLLSLLQPGDDVELRVSMPRKQQLAIPARVVRKQPTGVGLRFARAEPRFDAAEILATLPPS